MGGHPLKTWRHGEDETTSWPHWLGEEFPDVGVWSVGYAAAPFSKWSILARLPWTRGLAGHGSALPVQGRQILDRLALRGFGKRPLFFICHSLGGLVAKQILRTAHENGEAEKHEIFAATQGVLFLGTPHRGAALASLFSQFRDAFGSTVTMEGLRAHDAHLEDLAFWFRRTFPRNGVAIHSYYEELKVGPAQIVNATSADAGCGTDPIGLEEDHLSIAKPRARDAHVCDAARRMLRAFAPAQHNESPGSRTPAHVAGMRPASPDFVGRTKELRQLIERLRRRSNTAVIAPAGYGKTELAVQALDQIEREGALAGFFPDGVVLLDLYVLRGVAEPIWNSLASSITSQEEGEPANALRRARRALAGKRLLVVIEGGEEADGREGRIAMAHLLTEIGGDNRWLLLTRSRGQASPQDSVFIPDPLSDGESAELFDRIAGGISMDDGTRGGILRLVQGRPLALRWAAAQVAVGIDHPQAFLRDWEADASARLADPADPMRTLGWLFARTTRRLDERTMLVLGAAGKLGHAAFPLAALPGALCLPETQIRDALRLLTRLQLLRLSDVVDHWQFVHVLAYQFARRMASATPAILAGLGNWCRAEMERHTGSAGTAPDMERLDAALIHTAALLDADEGHVLWTELGEPGLYRLFPRIREIGSLGKAQLLLSAIESWMGTLPESVAASDDWTRKSSSALSARGEIRRLRGDLPGALQDFQQSLQVFQRLADSDPSNTQWQRDLSVSLDYIGRTRSDQGDLPGALQAFQQSLQIRQRLADSDPSNTQWQRDLSVALDNIGRIRRDQGDLPGALQDFQQSLQIRQRLADSDPSNTQWLRDLSVALNNIGRIRRDQGDLPGALQDFQQSLQIRQRLAASDPSNTQWQRDLSISHALMAESFEQAGQLAEALEYALHSLTIDQRLSVRDPTNTQWQNDLDSSRQLVERLRAATDSPA